MATMLSWGDEAMEEEEISSPEKDYGMSPTSGPMESDDLASVEGSPISAAKSDSMNFDATKMVISCTVRIVQKTTSLLQLTNTLNTTNEASRHMGLTMIRDEEEDSTMINQIPTQWLWQRQTYV